MSKTICAVISVCIALTGCSRRQSGSQQKANSIQIKGSDTMVNLVQSWAEEFAKKNGNANIAVTGGGSGTGIAALLNATCDIAMSSRAIEGKEIILANEKGIKPLEHIVALDGLAVIVNPANPVSKLTIDELRDIFMGTVTNWKNLGGMDLKIVLLSREVNSGTHVFFKEHVIRKGNPKGPEEFAPTSLLMPSSQAIADETAQNENAIGYYGMGYISPAHKVIAVAKDKKSRFYEPAAEHIKTNKYPISRPLYLYTNGAPTGLIKDFLDFASSKIGQEIVKNVGFISIKNEKS